MKVSDLDLEDFIEIVRNIVQAELEQDRKKRMIPRPLPEKKSGPSVKGSPSPPDRKV